MISPPIKALNLPWALLVLIAVSSHVASNARSQDRSDEEFTDEPAVHLYVVRRALDINHAPRVRSLAHSGVLLETVSGKLFLLEYQSDAKAHLTRVDPSVKQEHSDHVVIIMQGWTESGLKAFEWTRQKQGVRLAQEHTVAELQSMMQESMSGYRVSNREHCHTAQERLREQLGVLSGVKVWDDDPFVIERGQLTFDAEGQEGGRFHSRVPHVPSNASGMTIGRGYDLSQRTALEVKNTLKAIGLNDAAVVAYAGAIGLTGDAAREYLRNHSAALVEITPEQQKRLFEITYAQIEADVKRICAKEDVVAAYGATDWDNLDPRIREVLIDLRYRGDYTPATRRFLQRHIANNDFAEFAKEINEPSRWANVPKDRFERRMRFITESQP